MEPLARTLIVVGLVCLAVGGLLYASPSGLPLGRLPGDLRIERPGWSLYLPVTSCVVISIVLSGALWFASKLR
jgi:hypothetical protein